MFFATLSTLLALLVQAHADVSHLGLSNGYHYERPQYNLNIPVQHTAQAPINYHQQQHQQHQQQHQHQQQQHQQQQQQHQHQQHQEAVDVSPVTNKYLPPIEQHQHQHEAVPVPVPVPISYQHQQQHQHLHQHEEAPISYEHQHQHEVAPVSAPIPISYQHQQQHQHLHQHEEAPISYEHQHQHEVAPVSAPIPISYQHQQQHQHLHQHEEAPVSAPIPISYQHQHQQQQQHQHQQQHNYNEVTAISNEYLPPVEQAAPTPIQLSRDYLPALEHNLAAEEPASVFTPIIPQQHGIAGAVDLDSFIKQQHSFGHVTQQLQVSDPAPAPVYETQQQHQAVAQIFEQTAGYHYQEPVRRFLS